MDSVVGFDYAQPATLSTDLDDLLTVHKSYFKITKIVVDRHNLAMIACFNLRSLKAS